MSRVTKFLHQQCTFERAKRTADGEIQVDMYGVPQYDKPATLKCRKEFVTKQVLTGTGVALGSESLYTLDTTAQVRVNDLLDGETIKSITSLTNLYGVCEGYECHV